MKAVLGRLPQKTKPKKPIDWEMIAKLASIQCTAVEIADVAGFTYDGLVKACREVFKRPLDEVLEVWRNYGRSSLRRTQWNMAQSDPRMAIWLGKQYLKQNDAHSLDVTGGVETKVVQYGDKPMLSYAESKMVDGEVEISRRKVEIESRIQEVNKPYYEEHGYPDDQRNDT